MALLSSDGPLDTVSAVVCLFFSAAWFLAYGLGLGAVSDKMPTFLTMFGIIPGNPHMGGGGLAAVGGGAFALSEVVSILPFFLGTEGSIGGGRQQRQTNELVVWFGFLLCHGKWAMDGNAGGLKSTFNMVWIVANAFMTYLHWTWVGGHVKSKLKLT